MIELKLEQLRAPIFTQAYGKLMTTAGLEPKVAYHIGRLGTLLQQELIAAETEHKKLVEKWAEFKNENGQAFWKVPDDKITEWTEANKNFHEATVSIDKNKIQLKDIEKAALSPADYMALEPVINEGLAAVEGGPNGKEKSS